MNEKIEKLKEFITSKKDLHQNGSDFEVELLECEIAEAIIYLCSEYDLKAEGWDFKQIIIDNENDELDGTLWMMYAQLEYDILDIQIDCDKEISEIINFYTEAYWSYEDDE